MLQHFNKVHFSWKSLWWRRGSVCAWIRVKIICNNHRNHSLNNIRFSFRGGTGTPLISPMNFDFPHCCFLLHLFSCHFFHLLFNSSYYIPFIIFITLTTTTATITNKQTTSEKIPNKKDRFTLFFSHSKQP